MPRGRRAADFAHEVEIAVRPLPFEKTRARLEEQCVARLEHDVADLHLEPLAVAGHRDHDRVVRRAKPAGPDRAAHERAGVGDDRLEKHPLRPRTVELENLVGGRPQATDFLELDDRIDHAHEHKPVARLEPLGGCHGRHHVAAAVDLHEEQPLEPAEPGLFDRAAHERAARLHEHLERILPRIVALAHRGPTVLEQPGALARHEQIEEAGCEQGHAEPGDLEHAERVPRLRRHEAAHDDVRARADERAQAAEDHGRVHRHEELRHAEAMLLGPVPNRRHHQGDHGRIVHECGDDRRGDHRAPLRRAERRGPAERAIDEGRERTRPLHRRRHDEQRRNREHALVAHALERLVGREHPGCQEHHDAADHGHVGGPLPEKQPGECDEHHGRGECGLPVAEQGFEERGHGRRMGCEPPTRTVVPPSAAIRKGKSPPRPSRGQRVT